MKLNLGLMILVVVLMPIAIIYGVSSKQHWHEQEIPQQNVKTSVVKQLSDTDAIPQINLDVTTKEETIVEEEVLEEVVLNSYNDALLHAEKTGKNVLLYIFKEEGCDACTYMKQTLNDPHVIAELSNYIFYQIAAGGAEVVIAREKGVKAVPAYMIINSKNITLKSEVGYKKPNSFLVWLNN